MRGKRRIELFKIFVQITIKPKNAVPVEIVHQMLDWILGADNQFEVLIAAIEAEMDQMERERQEVNHA